LVCQVEGVLPEHLKLVAFEKKTLVGCCTVGLHVLMIAMQNSENLVVSWQANTLVVTFAPFRIDILHRDVLVSSVNRLHVRPCFFEF
jgi:hypothetical protein